VNNQFVQDKIESKAKIQEVIITLIMVLLLAMLVMFGYSHLEKSDPYIQEVLSLQGDLNRGKAIFEVNCAVCHGLNADGNVGPSLHGIPRHKSQIDLIRQVISGKTPPMPEFKPSPQDMADLLRYLENL
jgi:mono/diheme cytochrome c family protein